MHRLVSPRREFREVVGDPGHAPTGELLGLEHEFLVHRAGERLDARRLLNAAPGVGRRLDPGDPHARRRPGGWVLTCDSREAEIVLPPLTVGPGCLDRLGGLTRAAHRDLAAVLPTDVTMTGASTHLSVSVPDHLTVTVCRLLAHSFAPAIMLLLDGRGSPGLLIRPRPERVELGGDYQTGVWLTAAAAMAIGAVKVCRDAVEGTGQGMPEPLDVVVEPAVDRFGSYVDRTAFGGDLYRDGATATLPTVAGGAVPAGAHLRACWQLARAALCDGGHDSTGLASVDRLIDEQAALPCTRPHDREPCLDAVTSEECPEVSQTIPLDPVLRPGFTAVPVVARWDLEVWWFQGARRGYASVPRRCLPQFRLALATGQLDAAIVAFLESPATDLLLDSHQQAVAAPALWDAVSAPTDLIAPERDATGTPRPVVPHSNDTTGTAPLDATATRAGKTSVPPPVTTGTDHVSTGASDEPPRRLPWPWVGIGVLVLIGAVVTGVAFLGSGNGETGDVSATPSSPAAGTTDARPTAAPTSSPTPSPAPTVPDAWVPSATVLTDMGLNLTDAVAVIDGLVTDPSGDWIWSEPDVDPGAPDPSVDLVATAGFAGRLDAATASALDAGLLDCAAPRVVCSPDPHPMPAGDVVVVVAQLDGPIPPEPTGFEYVYAAVFDSDGDPTNDFVPTFAWDFFQGTDRWYVVTSDLQSGEFQLFAITDGGRLPAETGARVLVGAATVTWVIPADELPAASPSFRTSAFRSQGEVDPATSAGDVPGPDPTQPLLELLPTTFSLEAGASPTPGPTSSSPTPTATAAASPEPSQQLATFVAEFSNANEQGDVTFLLERLHPAVVDRYGTSQCREYLEAVVGSVGDLRLLTVTGPVGYDYPTDGLTTAIDDAYRLTVDADVAGQRDQITVHYAIVDGQVRWFTDCGDPG